MGKLPLLVTVIAASALIGCASRPRQVKFSDGSVLTAKERTGDSFKEVSYVLQTGEILNADSATLLKDRVVLTNVTASIKGQPLTMAEYMTMVQRR